MERRRITVRTRPDPAVTGVPIRLYGKKFGFEGSRCELLYAGDKVPKKGGRVLDGARPEGTRTAGKADYGFLTIKDSPSLARLRILTSEYDGPLRYSFAIKAPVVGTHGVLVFRHEDDRLHLFSLAVPQRFKGKGLGSNMLARLERIAKARNVSRITAEVEAGSGMDLLLLRNGFVWTGDRGRHNALLTKYFR